MKIFKKQSGKKMLSLDGNDFATLLSYKNRRSEYEFTYSIDTSLALERGAKHVEVTVEPVNPTRPPSLFGLDSLTKKPSPVLISQGIQKLASVQKDVKNNNINNIKALAISDFTVKVKNDNIFSPSRITQFKLAQRDGLDQQNEIEPILQASVQKEIDEVEDSFRSLALRSILENKEDPSNIINDYIVGTRRGIEGIISKAQNPSKFRFASLKRLSDKIVRSDAPRTSDKVSSTVVVPIYSKEDTKFSTLSKKVILEPGVLDDTGEFTVHFKVISISGVVLERVKRKVEHGQNVRIIQTPSIPPTLSVTTLPARNFLTITQNDPLAKSVDLYRKEMKRTQRVEDQNYVFVANIPVTKEGGSVPYEDGIGNASDIIYRAIPKGIQSQSGLVFTNKVAKKYNFGLPRERTNKFLYAGIIPQSIEGGVKIEVVSVPPGVSGIKLLSRDITNNEKTYTNVLSAFDRESIIYVTEAPQSYFFLDSASKDFHVIEYTLVLLYKNGDEELSTNVEYYKNIPFSFGVVDTVVSQPRIFQTTNGVDVQFSIDSSITKSNISVLKQLLEEQGQSTLFLDELENEKDSLDELIAHQVRRVDLSTGKSVVFKTLIGKNFSDERNRVIDSIEPLRAGRSYRYVVSVMLRTPETLFENNIKTITNSASISVSYLPQNFRHPVTQRFGNLVSKQSLLRNYSEDQMEFGIVGNFVAQDVTIDISKPKAFNAKVVRFNNKINIVRWNVSGEKNLIDHFLIVLEKMGDREIIGKVHVNTNSNVIEFVDKKALEEPGSYKYKIIGVLKDYSEMPATETQETI